MFLQRDVVDEFEKQAFLKEVRSVNQSYDTPGFANSFVNSSWRK